MTRRGTIKVMQNKQGVPRIMHEVDGEIKVYSLEQWNAFLAKQEDSTVKVDIKLPDAEVEEGDEPKKKVIKKKTASKPKAKK